VGVASLRNVKHAWGSPNPGAQERADPPPPGEGQLSRDPVAVVIVGAPIAAEPTLELGVAILEPHGVDLRDVGRVDGELDLQPVRARRVDRLAVAVIRLAERQAGGFHALGDLAVGLVIDQHGEVLALLRAHRLERVIRIGVGILEESERAAVGERIERVTVVDVASESAVIGTFAPGRGERDADDVFPKLPVCLVILHHKRVVMQPLRQTGERFGLRLGVDVHRLLRHSNLPVV
jgi:hypothetical protein